MMGRSFSSVRQELKRVAERWERTSQHMEEDARAAGRDAAEHLQSAAGPDHPDTRSARQLAGLDPIIR